jgi:hypothetical protein
MFRPPSTNPFVCGAVWNQPLYVALYVSGPLQLYTVNVAETVPILRRDSHTEHDVIAPASARNQRSTSGI